MDRSSICVLLLQVFIAASNTQEQTRSTSSSHTYFPYVPSGYYPYSAQPHYPYAPFTFPPHMSSSYSQMQPQAASVFSYPFPFYPSYPTYIPTTAAQNPYPQLHSHGRSSLPADQHRLPPSSITTTTEPVKVSLLNNTDDNCTTVSNSTALQPSNSTQEIEQANPLPSLTTGNSVHVQPSNSTQEVQQVNPMPSLTTGNSIHVQPSNSTQEVQQANPLPSLTTGNSVHVQSSNSTQEVQQANPLPSLTTGNSVYVQPSYSTGNWLYNPFNSVYGNLPMRQPFYPPGYGPWNPFVLNPSMLQPRTNASIVPWLQSPYNPYARSANPAASTSFSVPTPNDETSNSGMPGIVSSTGDDVESLPPQVKEFIDLIPDILSMSESPTLDPSAYANQLPNYGAAATAVFHSGKQRKPTTGFHSATTGSFTPAGFHNGPASFHEPWKSVFKKKPYVQRRYHDNYVRK